MIERITLLGSSSGRNAGDAALIAGIMDAIDTELGRKIRYEIPTINPRYILEEYDNHTVPIGMMPWHGAVRMLGIPTWRSIMRTDLTLLFDAILFDRSLYNPAFNFMSSLYLMLPRAKKRGKRMGCFNVGTGPVSRDMGKKMLKELAELMDFTTARDQASYDILMDLEVRNPNVAIAADSAVSLRPSSDERAREILKTVGMSPDEEILCINVNRYIDTWAGTGRDSIGKDTFAAIYAEALSRVAAEIKVPILFVATQHHDVEVSREVIKHITGEVRTGLVSNETINHRDIKAVFGQTDLMFGMRLHACILASSAMTPILGLRYQPKVEYYLQSLGLADTCCITFDRFDVESLAAFILAGWGNRHQLKAVLQEKIPVLQHKADSTAKLVAAIDRDEEIPPAIAALP
jgi:polysaccharide pyruvyl transferase WcaK-like protein